MKHIYGFKSWEYDKELKIIEVEVIKETNGLYVVKPDWERTVRKSIMANGSWTFFETYKEALKGFEEYVKNKIGCCRKEIEYRQRIIKDCEESLLKLGVRQ